MITINGQKMARSLGNFITLDELFTGGHALLQQAYSPMTIRFFILQAHYRSTMDFSNEALQSAEKGFTRLMKAADTIKKLKPSETSTLDIQKLREKCYEAINDDLNSPVLLSHLFDGAKYINSVNDGLEKLTAEDIESLRELFSTFVYDILGLKDESEEKSDEKLTNDLVNFILNLRQEAKGRKDWQTSDKIRDDLSKLGITIKDRKDGADWERG